MRKNREILKTLIELLIEQSDCTVGPTWCINSHKVRGGLIQTRTTEGLGVKCTAATEFHEFLSAICVLSAGLVKKDLL